MAALHNAPPIRRQPLLAPPITLRISYVLSHLSNLQVNVPHKTDRMILQDASLELLSGEVCLVCAPSGEGKSTLLRAILLQEMPFRGEIMFQLPRDACGWPRPAAGSGSGQDASKPWEWAKFSFLKDDVRVPRQRMALISPAAAGRWLQTCSHSGSPQHFACWP